MGLYISQRFIDSEERRLSYYVYGNEKSEHSLFFLNGLYHGHTTWVKQRRHGFFYKNYRMIFMDYRGLGGSIEKRSDRYSFYDIAKDINLIMDLERIHKMNIVGYSVGGMIALWFTCKFQEKVDRLILLNTSVRVSSHGTKLIDGLCKLVKEGCSLETIFSLVYPWNHSNDYLEKIGGMDQSICHNYVSYNQNIDALLALFGAIRDRGDITSFLQDIIVPTLLVGSDEDVIFPIQYQNETVTRMKNCKYHVIRYCGHASFIEKYLEVNLLIEKFLKEAGFGCY